MHFFQGSEHPLHQDQYYLPDCMSAWIAMEDVNDENGPLCLQPQSHLGRLITKKEVPLPQEGENYEQQETDRYFPIVKKTIDKKTWIHFSPLRVIWIKLYFLSKT